MTVYEDTICHNVNECIEQLTGLIETHEIDPIDVINRLHKIREQAQKMENALKARKSIMIRENLETEYQASKNKAYSPTGINKINEEQEEVLDRQVVFEITVKRDGEVIYQNEGVAGVFSVAEHIEDIDDEGQVTGTSQKFMFGNPIMTWFAYDQLRIGIEARGAEFLMAIKDAIKTGKFFNSEARKKIINATNKFGGKA